MTEAEALTKFTEAFQTAHAAFLQVQKKREYRDLSPRFWVAWLDLELAIRDVLPFDELKVVFKQAYRYIGAPGDFGYGTPQGKGLQ